MEARNPSFSAAACGGPLDMSAVTAFGVPLASVEPGAPAEVVPAVVVVERGAGSASALARYAGYAGDRVALVQGPAEDPMTFARRVAARVARITVRGDTLRSALILVGPDASERAGEARSLVARALLRSLQASGPGDLAFVARPRASNRHDLFALAGALCEGLGGTEVSVRVELREEGESTDRAA